MSESLRRGLRVLTALAEDPASASQVAEANEISLSTAVRLLRLLETEGFARQDEAGRYHVGSKLLGVAYQVVATIDMREVAKPFLRELHNRTGQTVHLGQFEKPTLIYIDKYTGTAPVQMYSRIGVAAPLYCTAMGKAVTAFLGEAEREHLATAQEYHQFTERTIGDERSLLAELDQVRAHGYALNLGEHEDMVSAIAAPLRQPDGRVHYGIDLAVPNFIVDERALRAWIPDLLEVAAEIERAAGYRN